MAYQTGRSSVANTKQQTLRTRGGRTWQTIVKEIRVAVSKVEVNRLQAVKVSEKVVAKVSGAVNKVVRATSKVVRAKKAVNRATVNPTWQSR